MRTVVASFQRHGDLKFVDRSLELALATGVLGGLTGHLDSHLGKGGPNPSIGALDIGLYVGLRTLRGHVDSRQRPASRGGDHAARGETYSGNDQHHARFPAYRITS